MMPKPLRRAYDSALKAFLAACVKHPILRKVRYLRWNRLKRRYVEISKQTVPDERSVVFECFNGSQFTCSPRAIYLEMLADPAFADWTFTWSFRAQDVERLSADPLLERANVVTRGSDEYFKAFAGSKYWIQNNRVPEYVVPRSDQVYVQCWHGTPLKRLGCDVPETSTGGALNSAAELAARFKMDMEKWSYLLSPSAYTSEHLADAFGLPHERRASTVLEFGYPRNDFIRRTLDAPDAAERVQAVRDKISAWLAQRERELASAGEAPAREGEPTSGGEAACEEALAGGSADFAQGKKVLLYAPTFRDDQYTPGVGYSLQLPVDLDAMQQALGDEWVVLLRMHYYISNNIDLGPWKGFAFDVSSWPDINELYVVADALCTDYSSVFFDYANTGRPLLFMWPDIEHYGGELHGFYLDPTTLPGPKCTDTAQLVDALSHIDEWDAHYGADYAAFRERFCPHDDGHAARRVIDRVVG